MSSEYSDGTSEATVLNTFKLLIKEDVAVPVAAMYALVKLISSSTQITTWMQLSDALKKAINTLKSATTLEVLGGRTAISLASGCELFMEIVKKASVDDTEFSKCKEDIVRRGEAFAKMSLVARTRIAEIGHSFVQDGHTVLVHGESRVAAQLIIEAAKSKQFTVILTEGRSHNNKSERKSTLINQLKDKIPIKVIYDSAVAAVMDQVDLCIVGAEGVMENGGIINKIGTYQLAIVAKALNKPFYVAVESYKFARMYPLSQRDVADLFCSNHEPNNNKDDSIDVEKLFIDFTPAEYINLLFTDLGVLTPAAVSDELIRLHIGA
jgi:translation initiation factor eIF-2B subunit alpha